MSFLRTNKGTEENPIYVPGWGTYALIAVVVVVALVFTYFTYEAYTTNYDSLISANLKISTQGTQLKIANSTIAQKDGTIKTLNGTITDRDTTIANLKQELATLKDSSAVVGTNVVLTDSITTLQNQISNLEVALTDTVAHYNKQLADFEKTGVLTKQKESNTQSLIDQIKAMQKK